MEINQKLIFITGKGGSGKTLLSAMLGASQAAKGKKVLLIDSEASGLLAQAFEHNDVDYEPVEVINNLYLAQTKTDQALTQYLHLYAKIPTWAKITPLARLIDLVSHAAPGVKEILVVGKICYEVKQILEGESDFDLVIVDAPSSGHILSLIDAPNALSEIVSKGMIETQAQWMKDILEDKKVTGVLISTLSDEVVMSETLELAEKIQQTTQVNLQGIVLNKYIQAEVNSETNLPEAVGEIKDFYNATINQQESALKQIKNHNLYVFPLIFDRIPSVRTIIKNSMKFQKHEVK